MSVTPDLNCVHDWITTGLTISSAESHVRLECLTCGIQEERLAVRSIALNEPFTPDSIPVENRCTRHDCWCRTTPSDAPDTM